MSLDSVDSQKLDSQKLPSKLEVSIDGRLWSIPTDTLSDNVRIELYEFFYKSGERKKLSLVDILQAYIISLERRNYLCSSIEKLCGDIQTAQIQNVKQQITQI